MGKPIQFLDRQGIHIGPQANGRSRAEFAFNNPDNSGAGDPRVNLVHSVSLQQFNNPCLGLKFLKTEFGMAMHPFAKFNSFSMPFGNLIKGIHLPISRTEKCTQQLKNWI